MTKYQEQYQRAKRYYEQFKRINYGIASTCKICLHEKHIEDDVRSFFVHCYHVRDWIEKDDDAPDCMKKHIRSFIKESGSMRICADLCNGIKHLERNREPWNPNQPELSDPKVTIFVEEEGRLTDRVCINSESVSEPSPVEAGEEQESSAPVIKRRFTIKVGEETRDAFSVAEEAIKSWGKFIGENGGDC